MATLDRSQPTASSREDHPHVVPTGDEGRVAYAEYGSTDGDPVVFFHGTPGSRRLGALLETAASRSGVRVLAPDRPGFGRSSPLPDRSVRDVADVVTTVLDDADAETAGLVAFSGGAPYALGTAVSYPDRVARVDIVSGTTPPSVSAETPGLQRLLAALATNVPTVLCGLLRGQGWIAERLDPSFVVAQYTTSDNEEPVPDAAADVVKADFLEAIAVNRSGAAAELRDAATEWGLTLGEIDADVMLWHGDDDTNVPVGDVRRLERQIPTAELTVLEDADHLGALLRGVPELLSAYE